MALENIHGFLIDANTALASGALLYWAKPLSRKLNLWSAAIYVKFPKLKRLPFSQNAGTEWNYKITYIWFRICASVLLSMALVGVFIDFRR